MDPNVSSDRIAVLIDADNTSHSYAEALLDEIAKFGNPTIKRAYGDWSTDRLKGWTKELNARAIRGMHQGAFTSGKNSTDSAMIIDAMDLLYAGNVEAFALVTSDSDFTSLALRLRESGKVVYGLGEKKTPASLQNACDRFIRLESLGDPDTTSESPDAETAEGPGQVPEINLPSALTKAVNAVAGDDGWAAPGPIGQHLSRTHPSLDPRNYLDPSKHQQRGLQALLAAQPYLETTGEGGAMRVRVKRRGQQPAKGQAEAPALAKGQAEAPALAKGQAEPPAKTSAKAPSRAATKTSAKAPSRAAAKTSANAPSRAAAKTSAKAPAQAASATGDASQATKPQVTTTTRAAKKAARATKA